MGKQRADKISVPETTTCTVESVECGGDAALHGSQDGSVDFKGRPVNMQYSGRWRASSFLMVAELLERIAYYCIGANLETYLTAVLREGTATSSTNVFNWSGASWIIPLFGAFVADAFLGRFRTIILFSVLYLLGMTLLTTAVASPKFRPPPCASTTAVCAKSTSGQTGFFYFALYLIALGLGGVKPNISTFGADQFDDGVPEERKMKYSFFNWWYYCVITGAFIAQTAMVYIQDNVGWAWGYAIPTVGYAIAFTCILAGTPLYRLKKPEGSPLTLFAKVFVAAFRNRESGGAVDKELLFEVPDDKDLLQPAKRPKIRHTDQFKFLDKAASPPTQDSCHASHGSLSPRAEADPAKAGNSWRLCTVTQVEEVKQVLRLLPIWFVNTPVGILSAQQQTFYTRQGSTMDTHMGAHFKIAPASLQGFGTITVLILVPMYDLLLVPFLRRWTGNARGMSMLRRMGIGFAFTIASCCVAAGMEMKRLHAIQQHGLQDEPDAVIPLSIFWLLPQYISFSFVEVFLSIAQLEFFYDQAPYGMRSLGTALYLTSIGVGNFWSSALVKVVVDITGRSGHRSWIVDNINRCRLDYLYWLTAGIMALNLCLFSAISHCWYDYKAEDHLVAPVVAPAEPATKEAPA